MTARVPFGKRAAAAWATLWGARSGRGRGPARAARNIHGAEVSRLLADWLGSRIPRDDEVRSTLAKLRSRARDLEDNDPTMRHFLRLLSLHVIGPNGARLQSQVRNNDASLNRLFNDRIEQAFEEWAYQPTRDGKQDFIAFQSSCLRAVARDGEVFVRKVRAFPRNRFGFALEAVDAELVDETLSRARDSRGGNEVRLGVEVDGDGRPTAYHAFSEPARAYSDRERVVYPADEIIHLYDPERVNQTRGVPWILPVMVPMRNLEGYSEAELVAARVGAAKMGFFQRRADMSGSALPGENSFDMEVNPGTFGVLPDGYELATWDPSHPSSAFADYVKAHMRRISTGLGVSYNGLHNDLEGVNYSSIRAGLIAERDMWRFLQRWWACAFLRPVFLEWLNSALLHSAVKLDSRDVRKFAAFRFIPRGWQWVDPLKDTQAAMSAIGAGLMSRTQALAEQGMDFETVLEELAEEQALAKEYGITLSSGATPAPADTTDKGTGEEPDEDDPEDDPEDEGADAEGADATGTGGASE